MMIHDPWNSSAQETGVHASVGFLQAQFASLHVAFTSIMLHNLDEIPQIWTTLLSTF